MKIKKYLFILIGLISIGWILISGPDLVLAFSATYVATTTPVFSTTFDGLVQRSGACDTTANYRSGSGTLASTTAAAGQLTYADSRTCAAGSIQKYEKSIFKFNLNPVPIKAVITNVVFSPFISSKGDTANAQRVVITSVSTASTTGISLTDYEIGQQGTSFYTSSSIANITTGGFYDFPAFNSDGNTYVKNTFQTASTTITARLNWDFDNTTLGTGNVEDYVGMYYSDDLASEAPKLTIGYTIRTLRGRGISR